MLRADIWGNLDLLLALGYVKRKHYAFLALHDAWNNVVLPVSRLFSSQCPLTSSPTQKLWLTGWNGYLPLGFQLSHAGPSREWIEPFRISQRNAWVTPLVAMVVNANTVFSYSSVGSFIEHCWLLKNTDNLFSLRHTVCKG